LFSYSHTSTLARSDRYRYAPEPDTWLCRPDLRQGRR